MSNSYQYGGYSDIKHMGLIGVFLFIINFTKNPLLSLTLLLSLV